MASKDFRCNGEKQQSFITDLEEQDFLFHIFMICLSSVQSTKNNFMQ